MFAQCTDFNRAGAYFAGRGNAEWSDIASILDGLVPSFQPSGQSGIQGTPIFDPKATNLALRSAAEQLGWQSIPVPSDLRAFGNDWDSGKGGTLAEWQFSNYPFLWNNVIRTEAVFKRGRSVGRLERAEALVIVTKSGVFPASNSSLYYEQGKAQLDAVTKLGVFDVPIRLVGLGIPPSARTIEAAWTTYQKRTSRTLLVSVPCEMAIRWTGEVTKYGALKAVLERV